MANLLGIPYFPGVTAFRPPVCPHDLGARVAAIPEDLRRNTPVADHRSRQSPGQPRAACETAKLSSVSEADNFTICDRIADDEGLGLSHEGFDIGVAFCGQCTFPLIFCCGRRTHS
jgi:hypothetical protein